MIGVFSSWWCQCHDGACPNSQCAHAGSAAEQRRMTTLSRTRAAQLAASFIKNSALRGGGFGRSRPFRQQMADQTRLNRRRRSSRRLCLLCPTVGGSRRRGGWPPSRVRLAQKLDFAKSRSLGPSEGKDGSFLPYTWYVRRCSAARHPDIRCDRKMRSCSNSQSAGLSRRPSTPFEWPGSTHPRVRCHVCTTCRSLLFAPP